MNTGSSLVEQAFQPGLTVRVFKKTKKLGKKTVVTWWAQALDDGFGVAGRDVHRGRASRDGNASGTANLTAAGLRRGSGEGCGRRAT